MGYKFSQEDKGKLRKKEENMYRCMVKRQVTGRVSFYFIFGPLSFCI